MAKLLNKQWKRRNPIKAASDSHLEPAAGTSVNVTPLHAKFLSVGPYESIQSLRREEIYTFFEAEMEGHVLQNTDRLIEHVFPDSVLPVSVDNVYTNLSSFSPFSFMRRNHFRFSSMMRMWIGCPNLHRKSKNGDVEKEFALFLTNLVADIAAVAPNCPRYNRKVTAEFAPSGLSNSVPGEPSHDRHPDILIFDAGSERKWETALFSWELKCNDNTDNRKAAQRQVVEAARIIYEAQDDRRFIPALTVLGYNVILHIIDRAGEISSQPFDIREDPKLFLRLVLGFMFASKEALGFDSAFRKLPDGTRDMTVAGKTYTIIERVYHSHSICGRGTSCWRATREGRTYAIKDCWQDKSRACTEADFLRKAKGVEGVPNLVDDETVQVRGTEEDSTNLVRPAARIEQYEEQGGHIHYRVHRRLVFEPFGVPITWFKTKKELIGAMRDVIRAHRDLVVKTGIIHRDISINNVMLIDASEEGNGHRKGLLIDLDYATDYPEPADRQTGKAERTGTLPFMAVDLLLGWGNVQHKPEWDLESLLYVTIWICVFYDGPNNMAASWAVRDTPLAVWTQGEFNTISNHKAGCMGRNWKSTLMWFTSYFEDLKPCISEWRDLFFDKPASYQTHAAVLSILDKTYDQLPDVEPPVAAKDTPVPQSDATPAPHQTLLPHVSLGAFEDPAVGEVTVRSQAQKLVGEVHGSDAEPRTPAQGVKRVRVNSVVADDANYYTESGIAPSHVGTSTSSSTGARHPRFTSLLQSPRRSPSPRPVLYENSELSPTTRTQESRAFSSSGSNKRVRF
ncbi:hypothetical protein NEOLEDRAFT_1070149 [Neolentinus lepideus HHB14362 ss-1]|uniref:Protein kinase domain-containing protein n=1 Tax=Neolentinus lepideus HHB14362 ss-1 TaxID=1314782 RepID=A0A165QWQ0_9AGAM|nr:hypothetical protein NEOLEDRAFT_1070149 [Neolentinus lepideus HHB14362 ss-1]